MSLPRQLARVTVLAGGWSASQFDLRKLPGTIIAVNDSAYYAPKWDICLSMDRLWHENRLNWIARQWKPVYLRASSVKRPDIITLPHVHVYECDHTSTIMAETAGILDGTNSGMVALNLAYQMRPTEIYLVGFDMALGPRGEKHWYADYPWSKSTGPARLAEWSDQFAMPAAQCRAADIQVYLCTKLKKPPVKAFDLINRERLEEIATCAA